MKFRLFAMGIMVVFLVSCASTSTVVVEPFEKSVTVEKSYDEVWSNLVRFFSTNDVSIATIEKDSGLIALKGEGLSEGLISTYCVAKAPLFYSISGGLATGSITVVEDAGFTTVNANMRYRFTSVYAMSNPPQYQTKDCASTGTFEKAILASVQ